MARWDNYRKPQRNCATCSAVFFYPKSRFKTAKYCSPVCRDTGRQGDEPWNKGMKGFLAGKQHYLWKGENVDYNTIHQWIRRLKGKPKECENCGMKGCSKTKDGRWNIHWANHSGEYKRDPDDFLGLCYSCHKRSDLILNQQSCG